MSRFTSSDGVHLVFGLAELEGVFELALPFGVGGEGVALSGLAHGVELQQLLGHVFHGLLHARLGLLPLLRAQAIEHRLHALGRAILLHQVEPRQRNVQPRALGVLQHHELGGAAVFLRNFLQSLVLADAVLDVHDVIADRKIAKVGEKGRDLRLLRAAAGPAETSGSSNRSREPNSTRFDSGSTTPSGT